MARPIPTQIYHFTHVRNLPGILVAGLLCDRACQVAGSTQVEIGSRGIKERRRQRVVPIEPGGCVGDYVPFYFAPRSPMMYTLSRNNYDFRDGFDEVVYLVSSLERLTEVDVRWIVSDRNAALGVADFVGRDGDLDSHVDWPLMRVRQWGQTERDPERPDRRMAECLAHQAVPWMAVERIVTKTSATRDTVRAILAERGHDREVSVGADWYF
jgi:hypothetical protein